MEAGRVDERDSGQVEQRGGGLRASRVELAPEYVHGAHVDLAGGANDDRVLRWLGCDVQQVGDGHGSSSNDLVPEGPVVAPKRAASPLLQCRPTPSPSRRASSR